MSCASCLPHWSSCCRQLRATGRAVDRIMNIVSREPGEIMAEPPHLALFLVCSPSKLLFLLTVEGNLNCISPPTHVHARDSNIQGEAASKSRVPALSCKQDREALLLSPSCFLPKGRPLSRQVLPALRKPRPSSWWLLLTFCSSASPIAQLGPVDATLTPPWHLLPHHLKLVITAICLLLRSCSCCKLHGLS